MACAAVMLASVSLAGCESSNRTDRPMVQPVEFRMDASSHDVVAGEIVTFTTRSRNVVGMDQDVKWSSTGGKLNTEQNSRIARVQFDKPGTYVVTATLQAGDVIRTDSVTINVRPLQ